MIRTVFLAIILTTGVILFSPEGLASPPPYENRVAPQPFYLGSWQDPGEPDYMVQIERERLIVASGGQVRSVAKVRHLAETRIELCDFGRDKTREISREGETLILREPDTGQIRRLRRLRETAPDLSLKPFPIPEPQPLPEMRILDIQREIWRRLRQDQEAIGGIRVPMGSEGPSWLSPQKVRTQFIADERSLRQIEVAGDNTRYLKNLIAEVGWIDVQRFGYPASSAAFLLVQHSYDLPLMTAVLPKILADVEADRTEGEAYALLFDRLQLALGEKQRFGSQVYVDEYGERAVLPVDEPERLDERRAALRMQPIAEYMQAWGSSVVRISSACSGQGRSMKK